MKAKTPRTEIGKTIPPKDPESWIRGIKDEDLKKTLLEQAKTNPGVAPSPTARSKKRRSGGFIFMRPVCHYPPCPGGGSQNPKDPCSQLNWVWQPDIAVQINTDQCPSDADIARIKNALSGNLSSFRFANPDVRVSCSNGKISIWIWGSQVDPGSCDDLARKRAQVPDLVAGGNFGVYLNSSLIVGMANESFQEGIKSYDEAGNPSINGPIELSGLSVAFKSPSTIETYIIGTDYSPWPPMAFTLTITDHLKPLLQCDSTTNLQTDTVAEIADLLLGAILTIGFPLLLPVTGFVIINDVSLLGNQNPQLPGGVGCRILQALPIEIPLPQSGGIVVISTGGFASRLATSPGNTITREKLVIAYSQPAVDNTGLYVGALVSRQPRTPSVEIGGPSSLIIFSNASQTFGDYGAFASDFFGKLSFNWSPGAQSQGQPQTRVFFQRGHAKVGQSFPAKVTVRVTDQEGSSVTASMTVSILVVEAQSVPPMCQNKPWLPQCTPG